MQFDIKILKIAFKRLSFIRYVFLCFRYFISKNVYSQYLVKIGTVNIVFN